MNITDTRDLATGKRVIRAVDDEIGTLAMAIEHELEGGTVWHLAVIYTAPGTTDPSHVAWPELRTAESARAWVTYLGELSDRVRQLRPVWCPNDTRETARDAAEHDTVRGLEVVR